MEDAFELPEPLPMCLPLPSHPTPQLCCMEGLWMRLVCAFVGSHVILAYDVVNVVLVWLIAYTIGLAVNHT